MIVAAQHVGDPHVEVVGHHGEVVDRGAVGAEDDEVFRSSP